MSAPRRDGRWTARRVGLRAAGVTGAPVVLNTTQQWILDYELRRLEADLKVRERGEQIEILDMFASVLQDVLGRYFKGVEFDTAVFTVWRQLSAVFKTSLSTGKQIFEEVYPIVIKYTIEGLMAVVAKLIPVLLKLAANVVAEIVKYLLFGFLGGPWATIIPTVLNILAPVIQAYDIVDDKTFDLLREGVRKSGASMEAMVDETAEGGVLHSARNTLSVRTLWSALYRRDGNSAR